MNKILLILVAGVFSFAVQAVELSYGIIGDAGKVTDKAQQVRESMVRQNVFKTIIPGDNLYSNQSYDGVWTAWRNLGITFDVVAIGNHNDGYLNEMSFFGMPAEYYVKVVNGVKFLVLNSDNKQNIVEQTAWLDEELHRASEKLVFLVYHHPSYTVSGFHSWKDKKKFQEALRPLIWKHRSKLTALIVGHDHIASLVHVNDLPMIVSGAVMEVRGTDPRNYTEDHITVKTAWHFDNKNAYWVKLKMDSNSGLAQVDYIRAKDDLYACTAILQKGMPAQLKENCIKN